MCSHNYQDLNSNIIKYGGVECLRQSRLWEGVVKKVVKYKEHIVFNNKCYDNQLIPKTIQVKSFDNIPASHKAAKICSLTFIKNRISQAKKKLNYLTRKSDKIMNNLKKQLPIDIINMVKCRADKLFEKRN